MNSLANIVGIIGVIIILVTYLLLQVRYIHAKQVSYSVLNFLGSGMILFSLFFEWNLPAAIVEGAWMLISLYGVFINVFKKY